jgi:high-affinity iron transporter
MLPSYVLALREGIEAALIIGIVLGALAKTQRTGLRRSVWRGVLAATIASTLVAVLLSLIGAEFDGMGEILFEGISMLLAAGLLTWMIFWMGQRTRNLKAHLESGVRQAALAKDSSPLFWLAFLAVLREGIELSVFIFAARLETGVIPTLIGSLTGLASAGLLGWLLLTTTRRLNLKMFFKVTNLLLMFFAAGLVAHGVRDFVEVGWLPAIVSPVWNLSYLLSDQGIVGQTLAALFGYNSQPSLVEVLFYIGYFLVLGVALRLTLFRPVRQTVSQK